MYLTFVTVIHYVFQVCCMAPSPVLDAEWDERGTALGLVVVALAADDTGPTTDHAVSSNSSGARHARVRQLESALDALIIIKGIAV